jgi:hypothetical protein
VDEEHERAVVARRPVADVVPVKPDRVRGDGWTAKADAIRICAQAADNCSTSARECDRIATKPTTHGRDRTARPALAVTAPPAPLPPRPWEDLPPALAAALAGGVDATGEEVVQAIRTGVSAYDRPLDGAFGAGLRGGVARALDQFIGLIGRPDAPSIDLRLYRELGRFEFREGRTLESLLGAYRLGARVAWRRAAGAARAGDHDAEVLALLAESIFAYIDELSGASAEGYAEEQSASVHETERRRAALLALLVQHPPADPVAIEQAARAAEWALPDRVAALVWSGEPRRSPALPPDALRGPLDDLAVAIVPDPDAPGRPAQLAAALAGATAAVGPAVGWRDAGVSAGRARQVIQLARRGVLPSMGLLSASEHLASLLVHGDPALTAELADRRLAPLAALPGRAGERLAATLRAWLDHQASVPRMAAELRIHPQTVRYRMRRLRELFGDDLEDPAARFELMLALRAR